MREMGNKGVCGPGCTMRHIVSAPEVIEDPSDACKATAIAFVLMAAMEGESPVCRGYGHYTDNLIK